MSKSKKRYLLPAKLIEQLYYDNEFYNDVLKLKKVNDNPSFPKMDQWISDQGFNIVFALAGYASNDIHIEVIGNQISISSDGIEDEKEIPKEKVITEKVAAYIKAIESENNNSGDGALEFVDSERDKKTPIFFRGIARRKFILKYHVDDEFDLSKTKSSMINGLLKLKIPFKEEKQKIINVDITNGEI